MRLKTLVEAWPSAELRGDGGLDITSIELDSRRVGGGSLFVCLDGLLKDGHDFAAAAVSQGAVALLVRRWLPEIDATQVRVPDPASALGRFAAVFFGEPSRSLEAIGITGTNGKTTVTHLVRAVAQEAGIRSEVLGTLGQGANGTYRATGYTTPEAPTLQRLLREAVGRGVQWLALEVSSHALEQRRSYATDFSGLVFTNLTRDHLDYHGDMESYRRAKARLFRADERGSTRPAVAVLNAEDEAGRWLARWTTDRVVTYGFGRGVDYRADRVRLEPGRCRYRLVTPRGRTSVDLPLVGRFNILNALAAQAVAMERGLSLNHAARGVGRVGSVPGRMERIPGSQPFLLLVDYAHTPDALERALEAARSLTRARLWVVFGCGGDRDPGKRGEMGRVAASRADRVVVTSDNPRHEDPDRIIDQVLEGMGPSVPSHRETDRGAAIRLAVSEAQPGDTILVAGKGHEAIQIVGDEKRPFDDRREARAALGENGFDVDD